MADELQIADETGLTYTAKVFNPAKTQIGGDVSFTESGTPPVYYGDFPSGSASANTDYRIQYIESGITRASERRFWNGTKLLDDGDLLTLTMVVNAYSALTGASRIRVVRFVTFTNTWSGITVPATWDKCYFTIKRDPDDETDADAIIKIAVTNGADISDGLQRINGGTATASQASIVVNQGGGTVAVTIEDDATSLIDVADNLHYDIKFVNSGSDSEIPFRDGYCDVVSTVTREI